MNPNPSSSRRRSPLSPLSPTNPAARAQADDATFTASPSCASTPKELARERHGRRRRPAPPRAGSHRPSTESSPSSLPVHHRPRPRAPGELMMLARLLSLLLLLCPAPPTITAACRRIHERRQAAGDQMTHSAAPRDSSPLPLASGAGAIVQFRSEPTNWCSTEQIGRAHV